VGAFTGDGMMAFFNDPLPVEDPCGKALAMALELQDPVHALLARWRRVGHDVGFGVGIAMGYANIGMIGFEGRRDYTALGPVVNLAARLCAEGPHDGILLDPRAAVAVDGQVELGEPIALELAGFERTIEAFPVCGRER
jgi:class 3 adenylate cyclase